MTYDKDKYEALRSLEVPRVIALALADDDSPLNVDAVEIPVALNVEELVGDEEVGDVALKVNELINALIVAGLMEEPEA